MTGDYSEELVELIARAMAEHGYAMYFEHANHGNGESLPDHDAARAILDALSSSGRLVPEGSEVRERIAATADTLHVVAEWGFVPAEELHRVAQEVAAGDVAGWTSCPVCEEIECDTGCPLAPVRSPSVPDTEEGS